MRCLQWGDIRRIATGRILRPRTKNNGYAYVNLSYKGKVHTKTVHKLVATEHIPNPLGLPEVNHKGSKADNRVSKLEWRSKKGHERFTVQNEQRGIGVHYDKRRHKWMAYYNPAPYQQKFLGYFPTRKKAREARVKATDNIPYIQ